MIRFLFLLVIVLAIYAIYIYNKLIRFRTMVDEAWSGIDVHLKKRYDLIPNLVNTVKGYASHEKELFEKLAGLRAEGMGANTVKDHIAAETGITRALGQLFAIAENYPELKANQNFVELQREVSGIESDLQKARQYYNGTVRNYNIMIDQFPSNLIASYTKHVPAEFFELSSDAERSVPEIKF